MVVPKKIMEWRVRDVRGGILTLWPGCPVTHRDLTSEVMPFFKRTFDIEPTPVGCVTTLPDKDQDGVEVEGTGGRHDFFFFVDAKDMDKFAAQRIPYNMLCWEDVYFNSQESIYPPDFRRAYAHTVPYIDKQ